MNDTPASLTTRPESYGEWLADPKSSIKNAQAAAPSWRNNHSD
jgi:hypothetical protein